MDCNNPHCELNYTKIFTVFLAKFLGQKQIGMIYSDVKANPLFRNGLVKNPILYLVLSLKRSHSRDDTHDQTVDHISSVWLLPIKVEQTGKRGPLRKLAHATSSTELGLTTRNNIGFYL